MAPFSDLHSCDTVDKLKKRCETLEKEIRDAWKFRDFYQFTFSFAKNPGQKGLGQCINQPWLHLGDITPRQFSLIPRPYPPPVFDCSMQIPRGKAWEIWSRAVPSGRQGRHGGGGGGGRSIPFVRNAGDKSM